MPDVPNWLWILLVAVMVVSVLGGDYYISKGDQTGYMMCGCTLCLSLILALVLLWVQYGRVPKALEGRPGYDEPRRSIYNEEFELEVRDRME